MTDRLSLRFALLFFLALILVGCGGPLHRNHALRQYNPHEGYRFDALELGENNSDSLFVILTFSGGGTRAAAFSYGVLQGLRAVDLGPQTDPRTPRRLLDEVDVISAVSGGSFTAIGYGLWGDRLFDGRFEERFLERDIQWALGLNLLKPRNLLRLPFILLDRIDIAAYYYDENVFERATYHDLLRRGRRPFVVINATDMARRQRFSFTQDDFDMLGSDLASLPVGWAVAASSAFPLLLSPLRLKYFPGEAMSHAVQDALSVGDARKNPRRYRWAESLLLPDGTDGAAAPAIDVRNHRYLYLLDGGLADNLGLASVIESYRIGPIRRRIEARQIAKLVLIIVDAATDPPEDLERRAASPGLFQVGERTGSTGIYSHAQTLSALVRHVLLEAQPVIRDTYQECSKTLQTHCPDAARPEPPAEAGFDAYVIDLNFRRMRDKARRKSLLSMITSFFLPPQDVDALIRAGNELLVEHPEFRRLMRDLGHTLPADHIGS